MTYTKQNWHKKWTDAKKKAKLKDSLFKKRLGPDLEELENSHALVVKADLKAFPPVWKKAGTLSVKITNTIKAYRQIVKDNVADPKLQAATLQVLSDIDTKGVFPLSAERNAKHHLLGLDDDDL